jgi:8-hydroxy-5-deazaflavin:NADPH oxidoreductase
MRVVICGGTGPIGAGLTARLIAAGHSVTIGSRDQERARATVAKLALEGVEGAENKEACRRGELVVIAVPWEGAASLARQCREELAGKVVISTANALTFLDGQPVPIAPPTGSVALAVQRAAPEARVIAALQHVPAAELGKGNDADVLVCGDDEEARTQVCELLDGLEGLRAIAAGPLALAGAIEAFTAVLLSMNGLHGGRARLKVAGLRGLP